MLGAPGGRWRGSGGHPEALSWRPEGLAKGVTEGRAHMSRQEPVERALPTPALEQSLQHLSEACRQLRARAWARGRHSEAFGERGGSPGRRFEHGLRGQHLSFCSGARCRTVFCESRGGRKRLSGYRGSDESGRVRGAWRTRGFFSAWSQSSSGGWPAATRGSRREGGWCGRLHKVGRPGDRCFASPPTRQGADLLCEHHRSGGGVVTSLV